MDSEHPVLRAPSQVIRLSFPKGMQKFCELCDGPARLQCSECHVTFYCDAEHHQADWVGIHWRICQLLIPIRTAKPTDRLLSNQHEILIKKIELIEICKLEVQKKLSEGKPREALPAARFRLRCSIDVHGNRSLELVPAYLLLAEVNMVLDDRPLVAEFLSHAEWVVSKNPECCQEVHHRLHRSLGQLQTANGNLEAALYNFANDIYNYSEQFGLESTITSRGFFLMAGVFAKQGKIPVARSMYSEIAHTWHDHLSNRFKMHIQNPDTLPESSYDGFSPAEGDKMLRAMLEFVRTDSRRDSAQTARVTHCLAMLWFLEGDSQKALGFGTTALQASQLIPNPDLAESIQSLLQLVEAQQTDPQPGSD